MRHLIRRASTALLASEPNYLEVCAVVSGALTARLLSLPKLWDDACPFCIGIALLNLVFVYFCLGRGKVFNYLGWVPPRRNAYWIYGVLAGLAGAVMCLLALKFAGRGFGTAPLRTLFYGVVFGPLFEEVLFRGALFSVIYVVAGGFRLSGKFRIILPIALSAILFAFSHSAATLLPQLLILAMGACYGFVRWRSNSVAVASAMHATYNLIVGFAILHGNH